MKIQLIDFGGKSPERAHVNDAGADVFSPGYFTVVPGQVSKDSIGIRSQDSRWICRIYLSEKWIKCKGNCM